MKMTTHANKVYKPEIMNCPKCGEKLKYVYTISNKVIQFSSSKVIKIKNMAYKCPICNDFIYSSATAHKMSFKGCTYSTKVICMIENMKSKGKSRDEICDYLLSNEIEISDRNVDILYNKIKSIINSDYDKNIKDSYNEQLSLFNEIRICVDLITLKDNTYYVILYNWFKGDIIAIFKFINRTIEYTEAKDILSKYINEKYNITYIITVRPVIYFHQVIKGLTSPKTKMISFSKF